MITSRNLETIMKNLIKSVQVNNEYLQKTIY